MAGRVSKDKTNGPTPSDSTSGPTEDLTKFEKLVDFVTNSGVMAFFF